MRDENRLIWEYAPIGIAKVERSGKFLSINPRFCEITGYSETELLGRTFQQITHPDDVVADSAEAANLANGDGDSYQMVKRYINKDGRTVWVSLYVNAVREGSGTFLVFLVFAIELLHIHPGSPANGAASGVVAANPSFWQYVKAHPREALMIAAIIVAIAQGRNIFELIQLLLPGAK